MGVRQRYEENKIKGTNPKTDSKATSKSSVRQRYEERNKKQDLESTIGLDTLSTDLSTLGTTIQGVYQEWQTPETMANTKASVESMYNRLTAYQEYQNKYGGIPNNNLNVFKDNKSKYEATGGIDFSTTFDDLGVPLSQRALYKHPADYVTKTRNMQTASLVNSYKGILDNWDELEGKYSGYKTKEEYDNAVEEYKGKTTANLDEISAEITDLEGILSKAKEYEGKVLDAEKRKTMATSRSRASSTSVFDEEIAQAQAEYDEYLASIGYSSADEIEKAIGEKSLYLNEATRLQEGIKLGSVGDKNSDNYDADYEKYVSVGNGIPYDEVGTKKRRNVTGKGRTASYVKSDTREAAEALDRHLRGVKNNDTSIYSESSVFDLMTDEEFKNLAYYIGKDSEDGGNRTEQYVDSIRESLNSRRGKDIAKGLEGKTLSQLGFGIEAGLDQFTSGIKNLTSNKDYIPSSAIQMASGEVRKDLADTSIPVWYNFKEGEWEDKVLGNSVGQMAYDTVTTTANMMPSILASALTNAIAPGAGAVVGAGLMGASASGNAYQEMLNLGYDKKQARVYSALVGISEAGLEYAFGGISALGGKLTGKSISKIVDGIDNGIARFAIKWGGSALSEGFEESAQEILNPLFKNIAAGYDTGEEINWSEVVYSGLLGALSGSFMEGGSSAVSQTGRYYTNKSTGASIRSNERVGDMLDVVQNMTPEESSAYEVYTRYAKKGVNADNISDAQLGNLYSSAREDAIKTLDSRKSTEQQKVQAINTLNELKKIQTENTYKKNANASTNEAKEKASKLSVGEVTEVTSTGNSTQIEGIKVEDDNTTLITSEGEVSIDDMTFNQKDSVLVSYAEQIATEHGNEVANVFLSQYDGNTDVEAYANSFNLVTQYTSHNFTEDTILDNKGVLSTEQVKAVYNATVHQQYANMEKNIQTIVDKQGKNMTIKGTFDDSVIDYNSTNTDGTKVNWNSLTSRQRSAIKFARMFSKATGVNVKFVQSTVENGKRKGKNGSYNPETNTIEIDVYAGVIDAKSVNDSIIPTLSHEITHWAKYKAPAIYDTLRNEVMGTLAENSGKSSEDRINEELARLRKAHPENEYTEEDAIDELVAKACEDMLTNSNSIRKMLNKMTAKEQKRFLAKIKETFENLMQWINDLLAQYKSDSAEAKTLREYKYKLQQISKTWDSMIEQAIVSNQALQNEGVLGETLVNGISKDGTTIRGENALQMSDRTYREGGREFLINWLDGHRGLTEADKQDIIDQTDRIAELMRAIENEEDLPDYSNWANMEVVKDENGEKVLSVIVKNGDYAMNIDFSQVCKKRVALNAVLNAMVQSGDLNVYTLTETDVADLNAIIKAHEFEIACALCFVDSKRYRVGSWAKSFCEGTEKKKSGKMVHQYGFNEMVRSLVPKGSKIKIDEYNFTGRDIENQPTKNLLSEADDSELDFTLIDEIMKRESKADGKSTDLYAYAKAIKDNKSLRKILNPAEIISSIGLDAIRLAEPELYRLINRHQGTARPKFSHDVVAYGNDILKAKGFSAEKAKMVGGVRCQSFSDFMANMVIDYAQFVSELSAKELTSHTYTKEPLFVKLFGLTGMKINMSLVPKAIDMTPEQQKQFAILKDKNANKRSAEYKEALKEYAKLSKNAGLDENGNYIWEDETFPYDVAMELVVDPRYSANCGTIAVGISDNHIRKLLADPNISMVIPYHKSGLNHDVAMMRDIALYRDYTNVQSTRFSNGKKLKGVPDFDFYGDLYGVDGKEGTHDPKKTTENYLEWCREHKYLPKFNAFASDTNYYKLLVDFRVYDTDGTYREQQPVRTIYPSNEEFKDLILNGVKDKNGKVYGGLKQQQGNADRLSAESQQIIDEYREVLKEKYGKDVLKEQYDDREDFSNTCDALETIRDEEYNKAKSDNPFVLVMDYTPKLILEVMMEDESIPANNRKILIRRDALYLAIRKDGVQEGHYHELGADALKKLPEYLENPDAILWTNANTKRRLVLSHMNAKNGQVVISVEFESKKDFERKNDYFNVIITVFDLHKNYIKSLFNKNDAVIKYEKEDLMQVNPQLYKWLRTFNTKSSNSSILNPNENVKENFSDRDSEGNTLSEEQAEFFKDSKVRDAEGNLRVVYHGTPTGGFTEFNLPHYLSSLTSAQGAGYYFTDRKNAEQYTKALNGKILTKKQLYQVYLNITNPLEISEYSTGAISDDAFRRIMARGNYKWGMEHTDVEKRLQVSKFDSDRLAEMVKVFNGEEILKVMKEELGHDGVRFTDRFGDIWVAWDKSQIKNIDNTNPTDNPDIRYSDRYEVTELTEADYGNMKKHFGTTGNYNVAGYLLKSGHMLDFSGKHWGDTTSRSRQVDHREIAEVLPDDSNGVGSMVNMISNGNIRLMPETGGINLAVAPTKNQRTVLRRYIEYMSPKEGIVVDIDEVGGDTIKSFTFDVGTSADVVMRTIDNYFKGGTMSELMRFHTQYSDREESLSTEELYNLMGENEKLKKQKQVLAEDVERLRERLRLESKVTNGEFFSESQLLALAGHLRKMGNSTIDKKRLAEMLRECTKVISKLDTSNMTPDELFNEHLLPIAYAIAEEGSGEVIKDEYVTSILKGIRSSEIWLSDSQKAEITSRYGGKWNNHLFGKFKISDNRNNDLESKWQHWAKTYPSIFDADISEADMGVRLLEIYDDLKKASEIVSEYNEQEVAMELAKEIYTQCWTFRPIKTTADRYTERIKKLNYEHRKAMAELKNSYKDKVEKQKVADDMYYGRVISNIRKRKDKEIAEAKRIGRERMDKYKENAERKTYIQRITSNALTLNRWLLKNSKDEHINEALKPVVISLLQALDFSSKRMLDKNQPTQKDISLYKALSDVKDMMADATAGKEMLEVLYGHNLDERIKALVDTAFNTMKEFGDNEFILNLMSLEDLATLDETVRFIKHTVSAMNKFHTVNHAMGVANLSRQSMVEMESLGEGKKFISKKDPRKKSGVGVVVEFLNWKNTNPFYAFKRYGEGGKKIFEALQDGWDKFAYNVKDIIDYTKSVYTDEEVKGWSEKYETLEITEPVSDAERADPNYKPKKVKLRMTYAQMMSLYCLNKREQARGHMLGGGIRVDDFETGQIVNVTLTEKTIEQIIGKLDARQKAVADKLQNFMNTVCADWGNEVSMIRFGYEAFGEPNYFPIQSDENDIPDSEPPKEKQNTIYGLLNMSFTKALTPKANKKIVISNIFDVFAQHSSDMAKYNALALPVLDANRWYNYTEKEQKGEIEGNKPYKSRGVKEAIEKAFGKDAKSYFTTFLKDINGTQNVSRDTLGHWFFKNTKIASVGANLRVVLLQPTSYLRASAVIDNRYLTRALMHKPKMAEAEKHCGIALWKSLGFYDINVQRGVEELIKHEQTTKDKMVEWSMKGAEVADKLTWGYLWNACELEIRDTRKDLKVGSKEFYEAIGKRLREVIYATQVVDSTMTRSEMMRSSDGRDKLLTAFASEPTLSYNMLYDAYMELHLDARKYGKKEAWKRNGKRVARVVYAYTVTNMVAALVESGFDAFRDDDEEEKDLVYFMRLYLGNFASDMSITGKIPYIKEIHSIVKGFSSSRTDTQWMETASKFVKEVGKATYGEGNPSKIIKNGIKLLTDISGLPFYNIYRDGNAMLDLLTGEDIEEMFNEFFE